MKEAVLEKWSSAGELFFHLLSWFSMTKPLYFWLREHWGLPVTVWHREEGRITVIVFWRNLETSSWKVSGELKVPLHQNTRKHSGEVSINVTFTSVCMLQVNAGTDYDFKWPLKTTNVIIKHWMIIKERLLKMYLYFEKKRFSIKIFSSLVFLSFCLFRFI